MGGVGSRVVFWTIPALKAACARVCVRASASAGGWGGGSPLVVHRGQDAEVAVSDRDASVLEPALLRPPRGPARLALRNLGLVELLQVRLDDRAVELPADAAEIGEDGGSGQVRSGQVRFITRPKSRTMRAKRKKRSRANRTNLKVPK